MKLIIFSVILGIAAIVLAVVSAILFIWGSDYTGAVGVVSTIVSTLLGVISIIYTYHSGNKTENLLDEISRQNKTLTDKIHSDLISKNFDEENLDNIRKTTI